MIIPETKIRRIIDSVGVERTQPEVVRVVSKRARDCGRYLITEAEEKAEYADRKTLMNRDLPADLSREPIELTRNSMKRLIKQNSDLKSTSKFKKTLASITEDYISSLVQEAYAFCQADKRKTLSMEDLTKTVGERESSLKRRWNLD